MVHNWKKRDIVEVPTLRGHVPIVEWSRNLNTDKFDIVTVFRMTSGRGKGNYFVEVWKDGKFVIETPSFNSKKKALEFAKKVK